jgi:hypothetical protein
MNDMFTTNPVAAKLTLAEGDRPEFIRCPSRKLKCPYTSLMANSLFELLRPGADGSSPPVRSFSLKISNEQQRGMRIIYYPSLLAYLYNKDVKDFPTPSSRPEMIRIPQSPLRCPWSGLSHGTLFNLCFPNTRNNFKPPVKSVTLRKRGAIKGVRLVVLDSLLGYLHQQMESSVDDWGWGQTCINMQRASGRPRKQRSP